ncbi:TlpA family protein disulfide reductase [Aestuariibacter sp. AA17]|uniref:TlpA family protein disulfide reductase n=1 Tax=Fluctibacter corallii TaxID=2984329 RepID=A0ABT3A5Z4_9ALTE|nr:TlpA disulfide reductase family protein [Aestuariibacter sp. AA17]MCV2884045.1 TlpA family protein disulfide reductase [Aestuariibacter sp. AA17]
MQKIVIIFTALFALILGFFTFQSMRTDFKTVSGEAYSWSSLSDEWVIVNYFAEWCAPCLREVPELNAFYADLQRESAADVAFFAVNFDGITGNELKTIKLNYNMQFPLIDGDVILPQAVNPRGLPATFIFPPNGGDVITLYGEQTKEKLSAKLAALQGL